MSAAVSLRSGDRHLSPPAYYALAVLAGVIGLAASYVTVRLFALAIQATEQEGPARELLTLAAVLFVAAELAACFIAGLVPVRRLRALRWQLIACAVFLVAFEAVSIYGARVMLARTADARAEAAEGRAHQLRASIEANRHSAAALVAAGELSGRSVLPSSRADGAQSIRHAAALEATTARMVAELAQLEASRTPTATAVFGESGVIALAVAQSLLVSCIGLVFLGGAGALARAARDAQGADAPMHRTATTDAPPPTQADAPKRAPVAVEQSQAAPAGIPTALPTWSRYALPASFLAAGAGLGACGSAAAGTDAAPMHHAAPVTTAPMQADAVADAPMQTDGDEARFLRVRAGIKARQIKPSLRGIYAAEGASQEVARRYLAELEQAGVIEKQGRGYRLATRAGKAAA